MTENGLIKTTEVHRAIAESTDVLELKDISDKMQALKKYARSAKLAKHIQNSYAEMAIRADRKIGGLIPITITDKGGRLNLSRRATGLISLNDIGLNRSRSSRCQLLYTLPEDVLSDHIAETNAKEDELTRASVLRLARHYTHKNQNNGHTADGVILPVTDHENCIYQEDLVQTWVGDAANMDFIPDNTVDLIVTSPPYNIGQKSGKGRVLWRGVDYDSTNDEMPETEYQEWQVVVLSELLRVVRPGGSLFYNHKIRNRKGHGIHPMSWIARTDWTFRQQITWDRGSTHNKEMSYFWPHDELIFWLTKGTEGVYLSSEGARMSTVWNMGFKTNTDHPAPFPIELPSRCIRAASKEGDLILDPFAGSLTTCIAAKQLNRRSIGVDNSEKYVTKYSKKLYQGVLI
jgi:site-specific DNA-methyltransferase (adenine-specific)